VEAVLATFGIDWHLLLINAINFGLLVLGLWYFLYAPLTRMLEERRQRVAQGVKDAHAAAEKLGEIEGSRKAVLEGAAKEADAIVASARAAGSQKEAQILERGEAAAQTLVKEAEAQAREIKHKALEESKHEVAKLIVLGVERAMTKK